MLYFIQQKVIKSNESDYKFNGTGYKFIKFQYKTKNSKNLITNKLNFN